MGHRHKAGHDTLASVPGGKGATASKKAGYFVGGVAVGVLLLIIWLVLSPDFVASDNAGKSGLSREAPSGTPSAQVGSTRSTMQHCVDAAAAMTPPLRRAASSVAQWETHVGAMNQLVSGAITLSQASAFWNRTRIGALQRIDEFERAWTRLQKQGVGCPRPAALPSQSSRGLRSCAQQVHADLHVLRAARTAITTWRSHVRAMNMLRMGTLSPTRATDMWLAMWHRGQDEINTYRVAVRVSRALPGPRCPVSAG